MRVAHGIIYVEVVHTKHILCHPKNRGGLLFNPYNSHSNLGMIASVGADLDKVNELSV